MLVQRAWRRYQALGVHHRLRLEVLRTQRHSLVVRIQSLARRRIAKTLVQRRRILFNASANVIQRVYRGHWWRVWLQRDLAARQIQKFMGMLATINFRDAVSWTIKLQHAAARRKQAAAILARSMRIFMAMKYVVKRKREVWIRRKAVARIYRAYLRYKAHRLLLIQVSSIAK